MSITENTDNAIPIEAWDTILFERFSRFRWIVTSGLSAHSDELLGRRPYPAGAKVHDVGCGFGDTTQRIARQVGPEGAASGVDCAANFVTVATEEPARRTLPTHPSSLRMHRPRTCAVRMTSCSPASAPRSSTHRSLRCATCATLFAPAGSW
jgi:hypothetical protein